MSALMFTDEELTAYLDGEADETLRSAINAALAIDETLAARLQALQPDLATLRTGLSLDAIDAPAMPAHLNSPSIQPRRKAWLAMAACLLIGLVAGGLADRLLPARTDAPWIDAVAAYQELYVAETLAVPPQSAATAQSVLRDFEESHGIDLSRARQLPGVQFQRAQMLGYKARPLLQMAYRNPAGQPLAVCVMRVGGSNSAPKTTTIRGMAATHWVHDGLGVLVIGGRDTALTTALAQAIRGS